MNKQDRIILFRYLKEFFKIIFRDFCATAAVFISLYIGMKAAPIILQQKEEGSIPVFLLRIMFLAIIVYGVVFYHKNWKKKNTLLHPNLFIELNRKSSEIKTEDD